ncbi:MAG TPA: wax ester/triacylglycerol synthase family O-acyltransferase [Solirubrobacteraceae bacterium]
MASNTVYHRLPSADAAFLHMDRPTNLMVINFVMLFDERVEVQRLRAVIAARLLDRYPRFRQLVVGRRPPLRGPSFVEDSDFQLHHHVHHRELPAPGDDTVLRELVSDLVTSPLKRSRPLWAMHLLDRPAAGSALVVRIHHCIVDGIALAQLMLSLTDATSDAPADAPLWQDALVAARTSHVRASRRERVRGTLAGASANTQALAKLLFTLPDSKTALRGRLGAHKRVAWTERLDLALVKATARAQGASVNDVLLAAVCGALRRHMLECGGEPRAIRTLVPFNLRPLEEPIPRDLGNRFGLVFLTLPVDVEGRRERLQELKRRMGAIKSSREGPVSYAILKAMGLTAPRVESRIVDIFTAKASAMTTNVPGPRERVYMAGTRLGAVLVWAPVSGSVGMTVSIFSYHDGVTIGLLADAGLVPEPQAIARYAEEELTELAGLAPQSLTTAA